MRKAHGRPGKPRMGLCGERQEPFQSDKQLNAVLALMQPLREFLQC